MALSPHRPPPPPSLPNFKLAEKLGQGAFGSVYKALNWTTGETCAVKQIDLRHIPESELPDIMSEIDLLKNLHHPNIVQYRGYARTSTSLYIVLEYCENGSLSAIIKKFGRIPESLVGLYTLQVLQGLLYLHDQGVIHRDIKGSNILATKEGSIKLADFGVATRVGSLPDSSVVGSPYWMAPEVVDQSGASPSSDIWSLGALVVELLTGKPPYHHLDPMPALFRIVNDPDGPPLPPGASAGVRDFLGQCFQKDGNLRVGARKLLRHPWMVAAKRQADAQRDESDAREAAARGLSAGGTSGGARIGAGARGGGERDEGTGGGTRPASTYEDEVRVVKEWNEALKANPAAPRAPTALPAPRLPLRPRGATSLALPPASSSAPSSSPSSSTSPSTAPSPAAHSLASALLHPSSASTSAALPALANPSSSSSPLSLDLDNPVGPAPAERDSDSDNWDSDFEEGISVGKIHAVAASPAGSASEASTRAVSSEEETEEGEGEDGWQGNSLTIRPSRPAAAAAAAASGSRGKAGAAGGVGAQLGQIVEDYSDLLGGEEDGEGGRDDVFALRVSSFKARSAARPQLLRPSDLIALSHSALSSPASSPPQQPRPGHTRTPSAIEKYTEHDEDDYDEVFADGSSWGRSGVETDESLKLNTRLSSRSWLGDEDSDEDDPFALDDASSLSIALADAGSGSEAGLFEYSAADLQRDQLARQCALVGELVEVVSGASGGAAALGGGESRRARESDGREVLEAALQLVGLLEDSLDARAHFLKCHGVLVILEALRVARSREVLSVLLRVVNLIVGSDPSTLEKVALIGGCPVVVGFASRRFPREIRLEAALFIGAMCRTSLLTLQMFVSCQGLRTLVEMLDEDYEESKDLIWMAVDGVCRVFEMNGPTPRNDFCRILTQEGLLDPLSNALLAVCGDPDDLAESAKAKIVHVLLLFAQSDHKVKEAMARRSILLRLVKAATVLEPELLAILLKTIKNLSMLPAALDPLQQAGAIEMLVSLLGQTYRGRLGAEIQNHTVNALFNLCRLSKARQAEAAAAGAIPLLQQIVHDNSPLKQFALPVLCDCAHAGKATRRLLWQNDGIALYLRLLTDAFWVNPALEAILVWLQDEPARVGQCLLEQTAVDALVRLFCRTKSTVFDNLLEPLHRILRTSPTLAASLAIQSGFLKRLVERLERATKALVRLNLLRITKTVFDSLAATADRRRDRDKAVRILDAPVARIARDDKAVLSRQLARSVVAEFEASRDEARRALARGSSGAAGGGAGAAPGRRASARRSVSESAAGTVPAGGGSRRGGGPIDSPSSSASFASRRLSRTPSTLGTSAPASAPASTSSTTARRPRLDAVMDGPPSTPARRREA